MPPNTNSDVKFSVLVSLFNWISKSKSASHKRSKFRKYLDHFCNPNDYFSSIRLILPSLDRERGSYGLKESVLALALIDALAISRESDDAKKLINWRKGGTKLAGKLAGNFGVIAGEVLHRRQGSVSGDITIHEVNELLDRLANAESRAARVETLGEMIRRTNWIEMKWLIMIILKDLKLGISEKSIFNEFHRDAEDLFNVTCDLRLVCEKLCDRNVRHKRQDIEVGKAVRPQLAMRVADCSVAWKKFHGKDVVAECKFDGDRIQVHKNGDRVCFFSRNFIDHQEYECGMRGVVVENVVAERCILDGEMLVWDNSINRFADFGSNQEIAKAAKEGLESDRQLCYVAFDILYVGDTSVIHQTLRERHELLKKVVKPVKGRLEILLPYGNGDSLNARRRPGEPCWSIVANHLDDVERFFKETIENRDEGIVLKDLGSKWEPGDRSGKWLKVKPDYVRAGSDLDVLIIGGYYGSGRKGGEVAQFLVGLAEKPSSNTYPRRFVSFCRVGTGLSDEELDELVTKLKPYLRKYEYPKKSAPSFYQVTNHSKERPDVWVESPAKSFIVSITSDIRTISSEVFAAPYSLRFPRIDRVRYDKPWHECLDVQSFLELVNSSNRTTHRGWGGGTDDKGEASVNRKKRAKTEGRKKQSLTVPSHFARTDVSSVKGDSQIFKSMVFHFVNVPSDHSLDSLHKLVVENGGTFSMNLNDTVTHCVGAESKGIKFQLAKQRDRDVIHHSWVLDCCSAKQLLPLRPKYFVFLSESSKKRLEEEIDEFSDSYFWDLNLTELKQIFGSISGSENAKTVDYYRKKYCPNDKWCRFVGCDIYFHLLVKPPASEWETLLKISMRRMSVEVSVGGGKVSDRVSQATHIVVMSVLGYELNFEMLLQSFPNDQKRVLYQKNRHVVQSQWLEDCLKEEKKLSEEVYSLKPTTLEELRFQEEDDTKEMDIEKYPAFLAEENSTKPVEEKTTPQINSRNVESRRKRGRTTAETSTRKGKGKAKAIATSRPPRPKRARIGNRPAKLQEVASDDEMSKEKNDVSENNDSDFEGNDQESIQKRGRTTTETSTRKGKGKAIATSRPPRSKRARVGNRAAKLQEIASDDETSKEKNDVSENNDSDFEGNDQNPQDIVSIVYEQETAKHGRDQVSGSLDRNEEYKDEKGKLKTDQSKDTGFDTIGSITCNEPDKGRVDTTYRKLDENVDPVQAMLLQMIPGLRDLQSEKAKPRTDRAISPPRTSNEGSSSVVPTEKPVKKKVSYKDLARQLLGD